MVTYLDIQSLYAMTVPDSMAFGVGTAGTGFGAAAGVLAALAFLREVLEPPPAAGVVTSATSVVVGVGCATATGAWAAGVFVTMMVSLELIKAA